MTNASKKVPAFTAWEDSLVCPACRGRLRDEEGRVLCLECGSVYPVDDGIPVLIADRRLSGKPASS